MAKVMDEETLKYIMRSVTTNDRQLQRRVLDQYVTDDVKFTHFLGDVRGRESMYGVYRAAATGINYKLKFIEMVTSEELAAVWVDLNIKLPPFFLGRYHAPTIVILRFRRCEDGLLRICEQIDHHSIFVFMWALGWPFSTLWDQVIRRIEGSILQHSGWAIDTIEDIASYLFQQGLSTTGWVLGKTLPEPMVQLISQTLGPILPEGVLQQLGFDSKGDRQGFVKGSAAAAAPAASSSYDRNVDYSSNNSTERPTVQYNGAATVLPGGTTAALGEAAGSSAGADAGGTLAAAEDKTLDKPATKLAAESLDSPMLSDGAAAPFPSAVAAAAAAEGKPPPPGTPPTPAAAATTLDKFTPSAATPAATLDKPDQADQPVLPVLDDPEALAASTAAANETLKALADAASEETEEARAAAEAQVAAEAIESITAMAAPMVAEGTVGNVPEATPEASPATAAAAPPAAAAAAAAAPESTSGKGTASTAKVEAAATASPTKPSGPSRQGSKKKKGGSFKKR